MPVGDTPLGFGIERIELTGKSLRPGAPPLRFAHLSDLHLRALEPRHDRLVDVVNERRLDFLCVTGDVVSRSPLSWGLAERLLRRLRCQHGIFVCPGNWEARSSRRIRELKQAMADSGAELLINESRTLATASGSVHVGGVDDLARGWPSFPEALSDTDADYSILLSHAPLAARLITKEAGVDLVLSGHTHGGQVRIPLLWRLVLPSCHGGFVAGLYSTPWGHVYVNRGFGSAAWLPFRFRCPPEVTFFEVEPASTG